MSELVLKYGKNTVKQIVRAGQKDIASTDAVVASWKGALDLSINHAGGLRQPQCGALFAIKAHWTVSSEPATIVMPTGTGKTETMIATVVSEQIKRTLVIVPSDLLRKQTAMKFARLGVLQQINAITEKAIKPVIATINSTPNTKEELTDIVENSNVVITTVTLLQRFSDVYITALTGLIDILIVDEAHHIAAKTWSDVKYRLSTLKCIQFTATPFRNDGKKLDGKIIYNFPLLMAQEQGYFQTINYCPLWEFDEDKGDIAIASAAVAQLKSDLSAELKHAVLVRAKDKKSADRLFNEIYAPLFPDYNPVLIHSGISPNEKQARMNALRSGVAKIVVCVDMFGEGIDIPNLKIAAIHDKYKSLPITLQFIGRFARTSSGLGEATLITNIANDELNDSLQELYAQDADWNKLLNIKSSEQIGKEIAEQEFAHDFNNPLINGVTVQQMRPKISMTVYQTSQDDWSTQTIRSIFDEEKYKCTINSEKHVIAIVERTDSRASWTSFRGIFDTTWNLHLAYWNKQLELLYINSTIKGFSDTLAGALFDKCKRIKGEPVFRCLHRVNRLMLGTVGLLTAIDGPIRFKMFAGVDVVTGISESLKHNTFKSNLFGVGYNGKGKVSIGCSHKGRIWSRWVESIPYWMSWCDEIGVDLLDESIDTKSILLGALVPEVISERPVVRPYGIDWPQDLDIILEDRIVFNRATQSYPYHAMDIALLNPSDAGEISFKVGNEEIEEHFELRFEGEKFCFATTKSNGLTIQVGKNSYKLAEYFDKYPPRIKFVDQSSLEGNILVKAASKPPEFKLENIVALDWAGTNIQNESQTCDRDPLSIQFRVISDLKQENDYDIIFDDDGPHEIADTVTIKECDGKIIFGFHHCKFSSESTPGARVEDLYELCGQAEKSVKWCGDTREIIDRLIKRENDRRKSGGTRIEEGSLQKLREIKNMLRIYPSSVEITIIQPGVDSTKVSSDMLQLLSGTAAYLLDTYGIRLKLICS